MYTKTGFCQYNRTNSNIKVQNFVENYQERPGIKEKIISSYILNPHPKRPYAGLQNVMANVGSCVFAW